MGFAPTEGAALRGRFRVFGSRVASDNSCEITPSLKPQHNPIPFAPGFCLYRSPPPPPTLPPLSRVKEGGRGGGGGGGGVLGGGRKKKKRLEMPALLNQNQLYVFISPRLGEKLRVHGRGGGGGVGAGRGWEGAGGRGTRTWEAGGGWWRGGSGIGMKRGKCRQHFGPHVVLGLSKLPADKERGGLLL